MASFPLAWIFGMLGIVNDRRKWLAVSVAIIAGGFLLLGLWDVLT